MPLLPPWNFPRVVTSCTSDYIHSLATPPPSSDLLRVREKKHCTLDAPPGLPSNPHGGGVLEEAGKIKYFIIRYSEVGWVCQCLLLLVRLTVQWYSKLNQNLILTGQKGGKKYKILRIL
jgi:hypothetical protein